MPEGPSRVHPGTTSGPATCTRATELAGIAASDAGPRHRPSLSHGAGWQVGTEHNPGVRFLPKLLQASPATAGRAGEKKAASASLHPAALDRLGKFTEESAFFFF